jgi:hypothetical protein
MPARVTAHGDDLFGLSDAQALEIDHWVNQLELGYRLSFNCWSLRDGNSVSIFLLRWSNTTVN